MASINSHRKRQAYGREIDRRGMGYTITNRVAPYGTPTMMPSKNTSGDAYAVSRRYFADLTDKLRDTYVGKTLMRVRSRDPMTHQYSEKDIIKTTPAGMANPDDEYNNMRYAFNHYNNYSSINSPPIYLANVNATQGYLEYSRRNTGLVAYGREAHKHIRTGKNSGNYKRVIPISDYIGGNIKTRHTALKWIGGIWREK